MRDTPYNHLLINTQVSTSLTSVILLHTTHIYYSHHSPLSVSLSTMIPHMQKLFFLLSHTYVPSLTLFNGTFYKRSCGDTFDTSELVPSLEPDSDTTIWINSGSQHEGTFLLWSFSLRITHICERHTTH